jgi:hypothetical protein
MAALAALAFANTAAAATIYLGASTQDYILYGQGAYAAGLGSFTNQQGSESYNPVTNVTTDTLSGAIAGSTSSAFNSGFYSFVTTYSGTPIGSGGTQLDSVSNAGNPNFFNYSYIDQSLDITLYLTGTPIGSASVPIITNGNFDTPGFNFSFTSVTCTGVAVCGQNNVGLTPGATISSPTTITIDTAGIPEPGTWALALVGVALTGGALRGRRRTALAGV